MGVCHASQSPLLVRPPGPQGIGPPGATAPPAGGEARGPPCNDRRREGKQVCTGTGPCIATSPRPQGSQLQLSSGLGPGPTCLPVPIGTKSRPLPFGNSAFDTHAHTCACTHCTLSRKHIIVASMFRPDYCSMFVGYLLLVSISTCTPTLKWPQLRTSHPIFLVMPAPTCLIPCCMPHTSHYSAHTRPQTKAPCALQHASCPVSRGHDLPRCH